MKVIVRALVALALMSTAALAAPVALLTGAQDPSQLNGTLNTLITTMNAAYGTTGTGNIASAITVPTVASSVDLLQITPSAAGTPGLVQLDATGSDTNVSLAVAGKGTGPVLIGGDSTTLAGLQVAQTASRVNDVIVTPTATGTVPTIISGGTGSDANIGMLVGTVGTGALYLGGPTTALSPLKTVPVASSVNKVVITGAATGNVPSIVLGGSGADANRNLNVAGSGTGLVTLGGAVCTATMSANAGTCNGQRGTITTASLSTAASTAAAAQVVTNSSVTAGSVVECTITSYAGTLHTNGVPVVAACLATSNTITIWIQNVDTANALNNAVSVSFVVFS